MLNEQFVNYLQESIRQNWQLPALADYGGEAFTYADIAISMHNMHSFFKLNGVQRQDKIALIGKNSAGWCVNYLSIISFGAVVVPILPDFKPDDLHEILKHSEARMVIADDNIAQSIDVEKVPAIQTILTIADYKVIFDSTGKTDESLNQSGLRSRVVPENFTPDTFSLPMVTNDLLAVLSYTSGTAGFVKGVMLQHNSLAANIRYAQRNMPLKSGDKIVSFLPLAHAFGAAFEFLFPFTLGCSITILTKTPSPQIILQAFKEVRPALVLSVPLVIEKIFKKQIQPVIQKWFMKVLLATPFLRKVIHKKIKAKLVDAFGGAFHEIVIGGAPLNAEVERFFRKIGFPFTVGYGMTECGPLISYVGWDKTEVGASGRIVDTLELRINSSDPLNIPGEIMVKGDNVMLGYYKNPELTAEIIDAGGWLHTGDLGLVDAKGNIYIKGRSKSMILGPSGKNIFPDEIESRFNNRTGIAESLVVQRDDKLILLIFPDPDYVQQHKLNASDIQKLMEHHVKTVNHQLPHYISIAGFELQEQEFAKTPKRSIKRFLYK